MSTAPNSIKRDLPLAGKYDKRKGNGAHLLALAQSPNTAPKPKQRRDLWGRRAVTELRRMYDIRKPHEMYREAIQAKSYALAWQILSDVQDRALGRPYVAVNPEALERHDQADVTRIAVAIKNLNIVNEPQIKTLRPGKKKALPAVVDAEPVPE